MLGVQHFAAVNLKGDEFHPEWNYTTSPTPTPNHPATTLKTYRPLNKLCPVVLSDERVRFGAGQVVGYSLTAGDACHTAATDAKPLVGRRRRAWGALASSQLSAELAIARCRNTTRWA